MSENKIRTGFPERLSLARFDRNLTGTRNLVFWTFHFGSRLVQVQIKEGTLYHAMDELKLQSAQAILKFYYTFHINFFLFFYSLLQKLLY